MEAVVAIFSPSHHSQTVQGELPVPSIRECSSTHYVGMTHPLNINNDRLTSLFLREDHMEDLNSTEAYGEVQSPDK